MCGFDFCAFDETGIFSWRQHPPLAPLSRKLAAVLLVLCWCFYSQSIVACVLMGRPIKQPPICILPIRAKHAASEVSTGPGRRPCGLGDYRRIAVPGGGKPKEG